MRIVRREDVGPFSLAIGSGLFPGDILKDPCDRKINIMSSDCHLSFKWLLNFNGKPFRSFFPSDEKLSEVRWKKFFIEFYLWGEPC